MKWILNSRETLTWACSCWRQRIRAECIGLSPLCGRIRIQGPRWTLKYKNDLNEKPHSLLTYFWPMSVYFKWQSTTIMFCSLFKTDRTEAPRLILGQNCRDISEISFTTIVSSYAHLGHFQSNLVTGQHKLWWLSKHWAGVCKRLLRGWPGWWWRPSSAQPSAATPAGSSRSRSRCCSGPTCWPVKQAISSMI